ncbi:MAG: aminotransferase class I/II-fold pyridoxal phosphate-dependent enzyme [Methanomassiliicoccales archaeon]|nr:aminotransferase class I/II-fold pyridoxal phosphate-dependent enzyme [Methanomassiliicoccales archaeon]
MRRLDLRSDTFTLPTKEMLDSIPSADLGDDVEGEDPTVNQLQDTAAKMFGTEGALLVASGTMGNLVSLMSHCQRGDEIILENDAHIYYYELGGMSAIVGAIPRLIKGNRGKFTPAQLEESIRHADLHYPTTRLVCIENTHNRGGGTVWTPKEVAEVAKVAHEHGLKMHCDGARIFNAAVALDVDVKDYMKHLDSLSFCLSKGLSCPVGSVVVGSKEFIEEARRNRKMVGGGMRQAGIIAAPGIIGLTKMVDRLKEDHQNARRLAEGLNTLPGVKVDMDAVQTNIVLADITGTGWDVDYFVSRACKIGVLVFEFGNTKARFVTHYGIEPEDVDEAVARLRRLLSH